MSNNNHPISQDTITCTCSKFIATISMIEMILQEQHYQYLVIDKHQQPNLINHNQSFHLINRPTSILNNLVYQQLDCTGCHSILGYQVVTADRWSSELLGKYLLEIDRVLIKGNLTCYVKQLEPRAIQLKSYADNYFEQNHQKHDLIEMLRKTEIKIDEQQNEFEQQLDSLGQQYQQMLNLLK